jgi:ATP:ADP antiporter, AAA family
MSTLQVLTDPACYSVEKRRAAKKKATDMSLRESAQYLAKSPYIRDLATLVIAYGTQIICRTKTRVQVV